MYGTNDKKERENKHDFMTSSKQEWKKFEQNVSFKLDTGCNELNIMKLQ